MPDLRSATLPVLPLRNGVIFPNMVVTVSIETDEARRAVEAAAATDGRLLLVPRPDGRFADVGTIATIQEQRADGDQLRIVIAGESRARVGVGATGERDVLWVEAESVADDPVAAPELVAEFKAVVSAILDLRGAGGMVDRLLEGNEPGPLADLAGYSPDLSLGQKVEVLEAFDPVDRLRLVTGWLTEVLADLQLRRRVQEDAAERIEEGQREFLLRQQMASIRKELGEESVAGEYREKMADRRLPEVVVEAVERELDRLEKMSEQSPEHSWIRTWLDTVLDVPWETETTDDLDMGRARDVLDADHTGLDEVKDRVIEHLAVRKLRVERGIDDDEDRRGGAILLLAGPPGVGKTSLGESVARALGRRFTRISLGGVRDEAEIRGHRRTYVGARPGRFVRAMIDAGSMNPVILLDELDKVGADWRGDPSSALLEVLDPAQNHTFRDHYLEVDLDLSDVLFIATANVLETIPGPLLDRTEVITIDGYVPDEKLTIARDHLLPRQVRRAGLEPGELDLGDDVLAEVVERWTREAGVRTLERRLGTLARKAATRIASGETPPITISVDDLRPMLGPARKDREELEGRTAVPGVATGLAVTGTGGDVLFVETGTMDGEPGLTLTGQLGDVMQESASVALSWVRSHADELGIEPERLGRRFHVHFPAGAIPKDGPSAGVTVTTALVGLLTGRTMRPEVAMTGEVSLQGRVLPIGGVKQKVLAAHRAGLTEVIVPAANADDLDDVPEGVREAMTFHTPSTIDEVLAIALA
ncbi:MAG: endopeptidase La [Acidimicrobiia bacterium]